MICGLNCVEWPEYGKTTIKYFKFEISWTDSKFLDEILALTVRHIIHNDRFWKIDSGCYKRRHPELSIQKMNKFQPKITVFGHEIMDAMSNGLMWSA